MFDHFVAARVLATYFIPGCVGRGVRLGSENSSGGAAGAGGGGVWAQVDGPTWGPSGWAHVGPTHERNGVKFLKICFTHEKNGGKFLKIFFTHEKIGGKVGTPTNPKIKSSQNQNPFCPNCRRGFLCRRKASPPHLGPSRPIFSVGRKNPKIVQFLPIFLGGPMGPIHPVWGPCCYPPEVGQ